MASMEELLDQMVRLQALQIKRAFNNQAEAIVEMNRVGIGTARIAELLGTTTGTVGVAIQRAKSKPNAKKKPTEEE